MVQWLQCYMNAFYVVKDGDIVGYLSLNQVGWYIYPSWLLSYSGNVLNVMRYNEGQTGLYMDDSIQAETHLCPKSWLMSCLWVMSLTSSDITKGTPLQYR